MSDIVTELAMSMTAAQARARLDAAAKKLIKHRVILAEIMKNCVEEFKAYDRDYIIENCFVGEVRMNEISVDQDVPDADMSIIGSDTEDLSENEGLVRNSWVDLQLMKANGVSRFGRYLRNMPGLQQKRLSNGMAYLVRKRS